VAQSKSLFISPFTDHHFCGPARAVGSVCVCVCVWTITFELNELWPIYLACWFSLLLPRSDYKVKVIGESSVTEGNKLSYWDG